MGPEEAIAVGDSLEHDIAGAGGAGCQSIFVCGGIHAEELGMCGREGLTAGDVGDGDSIASPGSDRISALAKDFGAFPEYAVPVFRW